MARNKVYSPVASYSDLLRVVEGLKSAHSADHIRQLCVKEGPKVGYKAFCYLLTGKHSAEAMKPDEAAIAAIQLETEGKNEAAQAIYRAILQDHPEHPLAKSKVS